LEAKQARRSLPRRVLGRLRLLPVKIGYFQGPRLMSALRKRWILFRNPHVDIQFGKYVYLGPRFSIHAPWGGTFIVERGVEFRRGFRLELDDGASVRIGADTRFTYDPVIQCGRQITIGERCIFGQALMLVDGNHRFRDPDLPMLEQGYDLHPIEIGDDVTVMTKVTIMNNIGERTVIGANSVVTKPIPPWSIAFGAPARVHDSFEPAASTAARS
jgi:acetyltransferase-like isoleucine patch superfamily enzyme